jgi:hypothetical protein
MTGAWAQEPGRGKRPARAGVHVVSPGCSPDAGNSGSLMYNPSVIAICEAAPSSASHVASDRSISLVCQRNAERGLPQTKMIMYWILIKPGMRPAKATPVEKAL